MAAPKILTGGKEYPRDNVPSLGQNSNKNLSDVGGWAYLNNAAPAEDAE